MFVYTDNIEIARKYFIVDGKWTSDISNDSTQINNRIVNALIPNKQIFHTNISNDSWNHLFIVESAEKSQFDLLIEQLRQSELPDRLLCVAVTGKKFHGFRGREWFSLPGNIHLSAFLKPECAIDDIAAGFILLSAVSVLQTIDSIDLLKNRAKVKWVNDILIDDAKVCGVLSHTQVQSSIVTRAVIGIGLNVESAPKIQGDKFIRKAGCLNQFLLPEQRLRCGDIFQILIEKLNMNYQALKKGEYRRLVNIYRKRSIVIGKRVSVMSDSMDGKNELIAEGKVVDISDNLELILDIGNKRINKGRIIINA